MKHEKERKKGRGRECESEMKFGRRQRREKTASLVGVCQGPAPSRQWGRQEFSHATPPPPPPTHLKVGRGGGRGEGPINMVLSTLQRGEEREQQ